MKRVLFIVIALLSLNAYAFESKVEIDGIRYTLNSETFLAKVTSNDVVKYSGNIVIPDSIIYQGAIYIVNSIDKGAFWACDELTSITIPPSVNHIGESAFYSCEGLTSINISNVTSWCNIKFEDASANPLSRAPRNIGDKHLLLNGEIINELVVPDDVTRVNDYAFYLCADINTITLPEGLTYIGREAFYGCNSLKSILLPNSLKEVGSEAFAGIKSIDSVKIKNLSNWFKIIFQSFASTPLSITKCLYLQDKEITDLTIPDDITSINNMAFRG